jgi:hypothetical protein
MCARANLDVLAIGPLKMGEDTRTDELREMTMG